MAYRAFRIDIVYSSELFSCLYDSSSLDGNAIAEALALAVNDARDEEVAPHAVGLGGFDDGVVRLDCLVLHVISRLMTGCQTLLSNRCWRYRIRQQRTYLGHYVVRWFRTLLEVIQLCVRVEDPPVNGQASMLAEYLRASRM